MTGWNSAWLSGAAAQRATDNHSITHSTRMSAATWSSGATGTPARSSSTTCDKRHPDSDASTGRDPDGHARQSAATVVVWIDYRNSTNYGDIYMRDLTQPADTFVSKASS